MCARVKITYLLFALAFFAPKIFSQETRTIPDGLRRPERGEAARYPQDLVIGELGQGQAPEGAYRFARDLLQALITGNEEAPALADTDAIITESVLDEIKGVEPRIYRLGGGKTELDGSVSFLVRFVGSQESMTGELYLRQNEISDEVSGNSVTRSRWILDDLLLEERKALTELRDGYRYDFSPYERFF